MKRANFFLFLILLSTATFAQTNYNDYADEETITNDDFSTNKNKWLIGSFDHNCYSSKMDDNGLEITSNCTNSYPGFWLNIVKIDTKKDFEIEAKIMYVKGEDNNSLSLMWGRDTSAHRFIFGFSGNGQYIISKYNGNWVQLKNWTASSLVHNSDYNKLTVRKIGNKYYFFLNEVLVNTSEFEPFFGQQIGFQGNQNTTMRVNNFKVSYLKYNSTYSQNHAAYSPDQTNYNQTWTEPKKTNTAQYFNGSFGVSMGIKIDGLNGTGTPGDQFDKGAGMSFESMFFFKKVSLGLFSFDFYSNNNKMPGSEVVCQFWTFYFIPLDWRFNIISNASNRFLIYVAPSIAPQIMSVEGASGIDYSWIYALGVGCQYAITEKYYLNFQIRPYLETGNQLRKDNTLPGGIEFKINIGGLFSLSRW